MNNKSLRDRQIPGGANWRPFLIVFIACFCFLGIYASPSADDYSFSNLIGTGFWQFQKSMFMGWSGRCFHTFLLSISYLPGLGFSYPLFPWFNVILNISVFYIFLNVAVRRLDTGKKAFAALLLQAAWLASVPALNETFYWLCGMPYTWTATLSLLCLSGAIHVLRTKKRGAFFYLLCLFVFFNGMVLEPTCVMQIVVLFFLAVYFMQRKDLGSVLTLGALLTAALGAFLVMYLAPGTAVRMGDTLPVPLRLFQTLGVAVVFGGVTALKFFAKPIVYVFLLFLPSIAENVAPFDQKISSKLKAWRIFALVALLAPFQQAIAGWATGAGLPARAEGLVIWLMAATWAFLWVFGCGNETMLARIRSLRIYRWRGILLALCLLLSDNFISLLRDLPLAPSYAAEMKEREASIIRQKSDGKTDVVVSALSVKPKLLFFSDIRPSPNDWKNQSLAEYWGISSISALPESMLNDERAVRDIREGNLSGLEMLAEAGDTEVQFMLGEIYDTTFAPSHGVSKDNAAAVRWYRMAADRGHAHACRRLTRLYALGMGVPKNYLYALGWFLRSQF